MNNLKQYIKRILKEQVLAEAISTDASYKQHIKSLFKNFISKFSAQYIHYREQNYPNAWIVRSISYAEDFEHQHIKLLYKEVEYTDYALFFEHEGSIYVVNDKALALRGPFTLALPLPFAFAFAFAFAPIYWHKRNWLFKLSISEFQTALDATDTYEEFLMLAQQMNANKDIQQ